ncbi:VanZ family protein [Streptomyces broussonetiae]|uniref:VanZ family protein n=1 Tax=Streptomyces broussonetiae TaxID=2686304 RepID=A0ABV5E3X2_9ACTN
MIEAVFQHHLVFLAGAIATTLTVGLVVFLMNRRATRSHAALRGLWAASATGPAILTSWSGSGVLTYECAVNSDLPTALTSTQGQLNIALFVPYGLFATLATRRPLFAAATGVLFTLAIETAQATIPFISRLCDTDDLITNALGACAGAALGALILRRMTDSAPVQQASARRTAVALSPAIALIAAVWLVVIEPVRAQPPVQEIPTANAAQTAALTKAMTDAFASAYQTSNAFYIDNGDGTASVTTSLPGGGFAELSWPDREKFTAHFTPSIYGEGVHAYKIPGISRPITTSDAAKKIATAYATDYAPWASPGSVVSARPIDDRADIGWIVEWRRWKNNVLMPMRLDIAIEPSGRIIDLIARNVADPNLPQPKVDEARAWEIFDRSHQIMKPDQVQRQQPVYLAQRRDGQWRIHWLLSVRDGNTLRSAVVDATDASVHDVTTSHGQGDVSQQ